MVAKLLGVVGTIAGTSVVRRRDLDDNGSRRAGVRAGQGAGSSSRSPLDLGPGPSLESRSISNGSLGALGNRGRNSVADTDSGRAAPGDSRGGGNARRRLGRALTMAALAGVANGEATTETLSVGHVVGDVASLRLGVGSAASSHGLSSLGDNLGRARSLGDSGVDGPGLGRRGVLRRVLVVGTRNGLRARVPVDNYFSLGLKVSGNRCRGTGENGLCRTPFVGATGAVAVESLSSP